MSGDVADELFPKMFPKKKGTILGVSTIRTIVYWEYIILGSLIFGLLKLALLAQLHLGHSCLKAVQHTVLPGFVSALMQKMLAEWQMQAHGWKFPKIFDRCKYVIIVVSIFFSIIAITLIHGSFPK